MRIDIMAKEIEALAAEIDAIRTGLEHGRYSNEAAVSQGNCKYIAPWVRVEDQRYNRCLS